MFCSSCGTENKDSSKFCWKCGTHFGDNLPQEAKTESVSLLKKEPKAVLQQQAASTRASAYARALPPPENFLWQAILVTLCCCLPFGIASIVYASQVNSKAAAGDLAGAHESASKARFWFWWALGVGLPIQILAVIIQVIAAAA